jgi:hypothetical protein
MLYFLTGQYFGRNSNLKERVLKRVIHKRLKELAIMKLSGKFEWTDYRDFQYLHMAPLGAAKIIRNIVYGLAGLAFLASLYLYAAGWLDLFIVLLLVVTAMIVGLLQFVLVPWRARKIYNQQKELSMPFEMEIREDGLSASNELSSSRRPWNNFLKWKENRDMFLLYHSDVMATIIPKRFLKPEQLEAIKRHLRENNVPVDRGLRQMLIYPVFLVLVGALLFVLFALIQVALL